MFDVIPSGKSFRDSLKGAHAVLKAHSLSSKVIELATVMIVLAIPVGAIAFPIFFGTNTTGWGATNILVWTVVPTIILAAIVLGVIAYFRQGSRGE